MHTPEPSKIFRNLPELVSATLLEPASGTHTSTQPSSGTCSWDPHRHTPELIWAEDPISLRCWGKMYVKTTRWFVRLLTTLVFVCQGSLFILSKSSTAKLGVNSNPGKIPLICINFYLKNGRTPSLTPQRLVSYGGGCGRLAVAVSPSISLRQGITQALV